MTKIKKKYTEKEYQRLIFRKILPRNFPQYSKEPAFYCKALPQRDASHYMNIKGFPGCTAWVEYRENKPYIVLSYPAYTDQRKLRGIFKRFDQTLKQLCNVENTTIDNKPLVKIITAPEKTGMGDFIIKRNSWIIQRVNQKLKNRTDKVINKTNIYKKVKEELYEEKPYLNEWRNVKGVKRELDLKADPYNLTVSRIKNIYLNSH